MPKRKIQKRTPLPAIAIVGDGLCEQVYFQQLREVESIRHIQIKPELPNTSGKGGFRRVLAKAEELKKVGYNYVFCLMDLDVVFQNSHQDVYRKEKKRVQNLGVTVIECNPCFEVWFLLHFKRTNRSFDDCRQLERILRQETDLAEYAKERRYFERKNLYSTLRLRLHSEAIPNSEWLEKQHDESQGDHFLRCEVHKVIQALLPT